MCLKAPFWWWDQEGCEKLFFKIHHIQTTKTRKRPNYWKEDTTVGFMAAPLSVAIRNMYKHLSPTSFEPYWSLEMDEGSTRECWFVDRKETI